MSDNDQKPVDPKTEVVTSIEDYRVEKKSWCERCRGWLFRPFMWFFSFWRR